MSVAAGSDEMRFHILGPLEVWGARSRLDIPSPQLRTVLAALLLRVNRTVTVDELIDGLWGNAPPARPKVALQMAVSRLRRRLTRTGVRAGDEDLTENAALVTRPGGYSLLVPDERLDCLWFEVLVGQARRAADRGDMREAAHGFREALSLWRGRVLSDIQLGGVWETATFGLEEARLSATHDRIEAEFTLGNHAEMIGELTTLSATYPLDERIYHQLMVALVRSRRRGDALNVYHRARRVLVDGLGVEPGAELRQLHEVILRRESA
jgi:SARP family transcriptional regulator, regulator of embCAB operon